LKQVAAAPVPLNEKQDGLETLPSLQLCFSNGFKWVLAPWLSCGSTQEEMEKLSSVFLYIKLAAL